MDFRDLEADPARPESPASSASIEPEPSDRSSHKKKYMLAVCVFMVVVIAFGVSLSLRPRVTSESNQQAPSFSQLEALAAQSSSEKVAGDSSLPVLVFDGPLSGFASLRSGNDTAEMSSCGESEVLTTITLVTDNYSWETSWSIIHSTGDLLAYGPPDGTKYERRTSYVGKLCLPVGENILVVNDTMGDGICCEYGAGEFSVKANDEILTQSDDANFKSREFPFELTLTKPPMTTAPTMLDTTTTGGTAASTGMTNAATEMAVSTTGMSAASTDMAASTTGMSAFSTDMAGSTTNATTVSTDMAVSTTGMSAVSTDMAVSTTESSNMTTTTINTLVGDYCVTIEVLTDKFSKTETAYSFSSDPDDGSDPIVLLSKEVGDLENEQLYTDQFCVPAGKYKFTIEDKFRGVCCSFGQGYYAVTVDGEEILYGGNSVNFPNPTVTHDISVGVVPTLSARDVEWLVAHNSRRQKIHEEENTLYRSLVWSTQLAEDAANWTSVILPECKLKRQQGLTDGENMSFRSVGQLQSTENPEDILTRWVDNKVGKSYPENQSLTQAVWRATRYVGCYDVSQELANGDICYVSICRYARAGNCAMGQYDDWKIPTFANRTSCGPVCPEDGCH